MGFGGGEKYFLYLADHLSGPRYSFHFVAHQDSLFCQEVRRLGYPLTIIDMTRRFNPLSLHKLTRFFQQEDIDLVHTMGARMNFYGRLSARMARVPYSCSTVQNSLLDYPIGNIKRTVYVKVDTWTARYAQRIISVAEALSDDLRDRYGIPAGKITTIHNGIDLDDLVPTGSRESIRGKLAIPPESPCVGVIGRLTHQKGFTFFQQEDIDLVHTMGARMNFYGRLSARMARVPYSCSTVQNSLLDYPIGNIKRTVYVKVDTWTARYAQRIISVAEALSDDLRDRYGIPAGKITTIHNGIDLDDLVPTGSRESIRGKLAIPPESPCVGVIGRLTHQKGFTFFLQALPSLFERFPALQCFVAGDGPLRDVLEREATRLALLNRCTFFGYRSDIPDLLQALDVLVLPSLSEGLPFILLEAMGMERPVVATAVSGNPELIEHGRNGLLIPSADPKALATAVTWLLENPQEAKTMGKAGRSTVAEEFSVKKMVEKTEDVYRSILSEAPLPVRRKRAN